MMRLAAVAFVLPLLGQPLTVEAQQDAKVARIGYLSIASADADKVRLAAFQEGLQALGYIEGRNIVIERRYAAARVDRLLELAEELVRLKVDVLVLYGRPEAVKKVSATIPIVFTVNADPVGTGLAASLARPGGNMTGLSDQHGATVTKRLELLKEVVPSLSRVAVLWNPTSVTASPQVKTLQAAGPSLRLEVLPLEVRGSDDLKRAFSAIERARPGAILTIAEPVLGSYLRQIAEFAIRNRLATIGTVRGNAEAGFLLAYGANFADLWRRAAAYVDKILKGANPGDLPIEQASRWDLVVNLRTAKAIGVTLPPSIMLRADDVIH